MFVKPQMYILSGLPASGKTTYMDYLRKESDFVVVSPDTIRYEIFNTQFDKTVEPMVWFTANAMAKLILFQGFNVVIDATNTTVYRRKGWIELAKEMGAETNSVYFNVPLEEVLKRNRERDPDEIVPDEAIERMDREFEIPTKDEGFDFMGEIDLQSEWHVVR